MSNLFRAVTIDVDGNAEAVQWDTTSGTLTHLQQAVGGLVDLVALHEHVTMWVNDEGIVKGMPMNIVATSIARGFGFTHQPYFGTAVFTGGGDEEGETLGLSEQHVEALMNLARLAQLQLA
jgi:hypothetical protein